MSSLFVEPFGGLAGDMLLAALLDLGDPRFTVRELEALARSLVPGELTLRASAVKRGGLAATHLDVRTPESAAPPHRHHRDLVELLTRSGLSDTARKRAERCLWRLAIAEGSVHGIEPEQVHFHEVGAVDTLIDVAGVCLALERLEVTRIFASPPITGTGTVRCAHGDMPVPTPAVVELLRGRELVVGGGGGERLTPTGAALLAELTTDFEAPGAFTAGATGYGAGTREPRDGPPNLVRVQLGEVAAATSVNDVLELRVTLDDMTGEELGHLVRAVRRAGALEAWTEPVYMKKDRPGAVLACLVREDARRAVETAVFEHSTSFGLRYTRWSRTECARETVHVDLEGATVRVKVRHRPRVEGASPFSERDLFPEHDDLARVAEATGRALWDLRREAIRSAWSALRD